MQSSRACDQRLQLEKCRRFSSALVRRPQVLPLGIFCKRISEQRHAMQSTYACACIEHSIIQKLLAMRHVIQRVPASRRIRIRLMHDGISDRKHKQRTRKPQGERLRTSPAWASLMTRHLSATSTATSSASNMGSYTSGSSPAQASMSEPRSAGNVTHHHAPQHSCSNAPLPSSSRARTRPSAS